MTTPNPTPARDAVASLSDESAMELAQDLAEDCIVVRGEPDVDGRTVGEIVGARVRARLDALITAARADEQAQWAARATGQERELVGRLMAAGRDERLSTGALYLEAAGVITTLLAALTAARGKADESCSDGYALGLKQRAEELAANKRLLDAAHAALTASRERGIEAGDVIERLVVCIDTDALHEELDAWAGDRMAATRILRSHITRALAGRKGEG